MYTYSGAIVCVDLVVMIILIMDIDIHVIIGIFICTYGRLLIWVDNAGNKSFSPLDHITVTKLHGCGIFRCSDECPNDGCRGTAEIHVILSHSLTFIYKCICIRVFSIIS
ncbi:hypothetical protein IGM_06707 [Bacillus cereus HuB4-4]|uniref:Uncharacterized protein n=1 Tax=Bacillus cereus HuB4-4 TaxID=1053211 RepID=A0A9W5VI24_BACCE|nr:hypothetical protein IGM_06707 [Bacillus cereus HuB4-4]